VTGELAVLAEKSAAVLRNGRRALPRAVSGRMRGRQRALDELAVTIGRTAKIVVQTRNRLVGKVPESATPRQAELGQHSDHVCLNRPQTARSARRADRGRHPHQPVRVGRA
jgi:hypothetical protein